MTHLNFNHLKDDAKQYLLSFSRLVLETKCGTQLKEYAQEKDMDYQSLLEQACPERSRKGSTKEPIFPWVFIQR